MKQVIQHFRTGELRVEEVPEASPRRGGILVGNVASLISPGTEKMAVELARKSLLGKARERPDLVRQVIRKWRRDGLASTFRTVRTKLETSLAPGYSCAGIVRAVGAGAEEFQVGERVACAGYNYASHAERVFVPKNLAVRIPDGVSFDEAAFVTLGAIAVQGVRTAGVGLGETVAVIGLGLIGQLTVQILRAAGCRILAIDLDRERVDLARRLGAEAGCARHDARLTDVCDQLTEGRGVDAVIITAAGQSNDPIELAAALARDRAVLSLVGAVGMNLPRRPFFEKELQVRLSRSYGPGRYDPRYEEQGIDYPIGYVRWTERRNMESFLRLVAEKRIELAPLITHRFAIDEAVQAYQIVTGHPATPHLAILLQYPEPQAETPLPARRPTAGGLPTGTIGIGLIGAGNFARSVLLPRLVRQLGANDARILGVATANGRTARSVAAEYRVPFCTTDYRDLLADDEIRAVLITTRHDTHATIAVEALRAGKAVFVEKPLAIREEELSDLHQAMVETDGRLMVGFNRRFSPLATRTREFFRESGPLVITYRVNAGPLPPESWIHGEEGGGRILGEVCHFLDFLQFLTAAEPIEVYAVPSTGPMGGGGASRPETVVVLTRWSDGSTGTVEYLASGDRGLAKERIEVHGGGRSVILDDFRGLERWSDGRRQRQRFFQQRKGFEEEIAAFLTALRTGAPFPISWPSLAQTTRATLAIEESIRKGQPIRLPRERA
jgi:polar amino acid transport system substrate-binding protein